MTKEPNEKELRIKKLANFFTTSILREECQKGKCFTTCYPLSLYLELHGVKTSFFMGKYKTIENIHYWLTLEDNETIIDPTIKQFNKTKPQIFIGKDADYFDLKKLDDNEINDAIYRWKNPFVDSQREIDKKLIPANFRKKENFGIILRAATILHLDTEKMIASERLLKKMGIYFCHIKEMIETSSNRELIDELKPIPIGFEILLSKLNNMACC